MSVIPYRDGEVNEIQRKRRTFADERGERVVWETIWLVWDADVGEDEEGWFAVVEYGLGYKPRMLTCWCPEGRWITDEECKHERSVAVFLAPEPDTRPAMLPNIAAFVD